MKKAGGKRKAQAKKDTLQKKPYGFCCEARKDEPLAQPPTDSSLKNVVLDAGGPNFKVRLEEFDKAQLPVIPKRTANARSKSPRVSVAH